MREGSQFWAAHVSAIQAEGISASAYSKRRGLDLSKLYYWQAKIKAASAVAPRRELSEVKRFVPVRVAQALPSVSPVGCTLSIAPGLRLEMSGLPDPRWVAALAHAAGGVR